MANVKPEDEKEEPKKKSPALLIVAGGVALFLIALILVLVLLLGSSGESVQPQQISGSKATTSVEPMLGPMVDLDQFIVNLLSADGRRYLKTSVSLELTHKNAGAEVENKMPLIRDAIIRQLSSKRFDEISTESGKERLREEIKNNVNRYLIDGQIKSVYFTSFVIQ
ncbi:MAG: flagellar basal body-associated FliL family protein [Helicobacteraceae bacterium]|jgi:flagellar FliL protein|nr:flagellar basal body-associated FliL family protein [Helicobacteraceae bacterium]